MKKNFLYLPFLTAFSALLISSCAGTINTVKYSVPEIKEQKKAYIISAENSQYIQFKPGVILPMVGYIVLPDDSSKEHEIIGNTDLVIKNEVEKYGIKAEIVKKGDKLGDFDFLIEYHDTWRWDCKKVLDKLEIVFISPNGTLISKSEFNIYKNKELHNFPTPEKEVPKMMKELFEK
ncbi:hypothetical protein AAGV33_15340 [Flavobacterium sp. FBOR7N2.3]|uniref:Lipoprotein n=1 Tax=Flavobacterium magnesitis TaxID=3138077 RepID=A0ABV4TQW6_9FLAO